MIARVRIAPVERWCPAILADCVKYGFIPSKYSGMEIAIIPDSMKVGGYIGCDGRAWLIPPEIGNEIRGKDGKWTREYRWACEHMLEMD